ncbi:hypothetical protein BV378_18310 [Nostoc sp. RF31YmG]|nr:hypothetical protein BV378_18310 [Nostoc sp. RF31YmG]
MSPVLFGAAVPVPLRGSKLCVTSLQAKGRRLSHRRELGNPKGVALAGLTAMYWLSKAVASIRKFKKLSMNPIGKKRVEESITVASFFHPAIYRCREQEYLEKLPFFEG